MVATAISSPNGLGVSLRDAIAAADAHDAFHLIETGPQQTIKVQLNFAG